MPEEKSNHSSAKMALRREMRTRLGTAAPWEKSAAVCAQIDALLAQERAEECVAFLAFQQEPRIDSSLKKWLAQRRRLLLPRFCQPSGQYELVAVEDLDNQLVTGHFGIREPNPQLPAIEQLTKNAIWLVPGLAFSASGKRLGRGAGYYDRLFSQFPQGKRIGIAWERQLLPEIPQEPWDARMAMIVTEARTIDCASFT